jgi:LCP family protein required for cell wall assembly
MSQTAPPQAPIPNLGPSTRRKRRRRPSLWVRRAIALGVLSLGAAMLGGGFGAVSRALQGPPKVAAVATAGEATRVNTLVITVNPKPLPGEPGDKATRRVADGLYLLSLDSASKHATILSIPRQTRALIGSNGPGQIGDALAVGGITLLKETVEGVTGLGVDHYVWLEMDGTKTILGALGKPEVFLPSAVKYTDADTGVAVDLPAGWQSLDPDKAIAFGLLRPDDTGIDHMVRQQFLMHQFQRQIHDGFAWTWYGGAVSKAMPAVTTDLPKGDFDALLHALREVAPEDVSYALMPGEVAKSGDWLVQSKRYDGLLTKLQTPIGDKAVAELHPTLEILYDATGNGTDANATQRAGEKVLALAAKLTSDGFQVVRTDKAPITSAGSRIVDRARADLRSVRVLGALEAAAGDALVEVEPDEVAGYGAQYTLELGKRFFK